MTINRNTEFDHMVRLCFQFQNDFFEVMRKEGYFISDTDKFFIIQRKLQDNEVPMLNHIEAKMFAKLVDITNLSIIEAEDDSPFSKNEYRFFSASQVFMNKYKKWISEKEERKNI